ncbi:MAG TPA: FHA domain-containing protein [Candidatus Hydrogenedentes bacterium]|nr:FHA domain-containing protein [Candidatus Hydrogenedentota bacterium]HOS01456.1 FHA domain-containing protein [Candidatus Hydrogenedentota bacterium]
MNAGITDAFVVINGPEDGAEFPVVRAPLRIGQDIACEIPVRLDSDVRPVHALVTTVSDGYRVRQLDAAPVYVNGKRAGMFRSRIVRSGGIVQVGHTQLAVECVPDGLAARSHGIVSETDLGWLMEGFVRILGRSAMGTVRLLFGFLGKLRTNALLVAAILIALYFFVPSFRDRVAWAAWHATHYVRMLLGR